jgi:neutral ceramidase
MNLKTHVTCVTRITIILFGFVTSAIASDTADYVYEAGMAKIDITGPPVGVMFWGYARKDQKGEGIHLRQYARSMVLQDKKSNSLLAYVTAEVGGIPFRIQRDVVRRLQAEVDPRFNFSNVLLNAQHTHSGPSGYFSVNAIYAPNFYPAYYQTLTSGIFESVKQAYQAREPAQLLLGKTTLEDAGINRSLAAYMANPEEERKRYSANTDTTMIQLSVNTKTGISGFVNWFGVHPTNMTFNNKLISSDNKGVASYLSEKEALKKGRKKFVAIFAQSNEGDVSPNLNLNNSGPGKDIFESTKIIGQRQFAASQRLLSTEASRILSSGIRATQAFIDMPNAVVSKQYTGSGKDEKICAAAYGYALAAGSTEEGGGHWLFREGMTDKDRKFYIDALAAFLTQSPSEALRSCHLPKAVLFPLGEAKPKESVSQIIPIGIVSIGDFGLIVSPHEVTTMSSRRLKETVLNVLKTDVKEIALSGLTNDFAGYVTTKEEYGTQQYEGGHTLHGPYMLDLLRQEYEKLANDLLAGHIRKTAIEPLNIDQFDIPVELPMPKMRVQFQPRVLVANKTAVKQGESVVCTVSTVSPNFAYPHQASYFDVQKLDGDVWTTKYTDADWSTKFEFKEAFLPFAHSKGNLIWAVDQDEDLGRYRLRHTSAYPSIDGKLVSFSITCPEIQVVKP